MKCFCCNAPLDISMVNENTGEDDNLCLECSGVPLMSEDEWEIDLHSLVELDDIDDYIILEDYEGI